MPEVFILRYGRCRWAGCLFCGYGAVAGKRPDSEEIRREIDSFFASLPTGAEHVKVFGSGSFLDPCQMPEDARKYFVEKCKEAGIRRLTIESRPEFITREKLEDFSGLKLEVAIGLEVADDKILGKLNKGFKLRDYEKAAALLHSCGVDVRTYLLVNPPYVADVGKSLDASVEYAQKHSDSVVLINLLPHHSSRLMKMWVRGEWRFLSRAEFRAAVEKWRRVQGIEFDEETFRFTPKFPKDLQERLSGVGERFLTHAHFDAWHDYLLRWYQVPGEKKTVLFLPCSNKKPYSESATHRGIIRRLEDSGLRAKIHEVMLSNAGVVPREFENMYPFNAYDWDERQETAEIKQRYVEVTEKRIEEYLRVHRYEKILCFLKHSSESYLALKNACKNLNLPLRNLLREDTYERVKGERKPLQSDAALGDLAEGLKDEAL